MAHNVVTLTDENFTSFITSHKYTFVKMYAPWCGHCKKLAPIWEEYSEKAQFAVAEIDCTTN